MFSTVCIIYKILSNYIWWSGIIYLNTGCKNTFVIFVWFSFTKCIYFISLSMKLRSNSPKYWSDSHWLLVQMEVYPGIVGGVSKPGLTVYSFTGLQLPRNFFSAENGNLKQNNIFIYDRWAGSCLPPLFIV